MIGLVLRKELLAILRDGRALLLSLSIVALFSAVFVLSLQAHRQHQQKKHKVESIVRGQWDGQGDKHPHRGAHYGLYVFPPESILAAFDPGVNRHLGQALWLEPHKRNMTRFSAAIDDPVSGRFGEFTPAFVLTVIFPVLIIALAFGAVAQEREYGTLRMLHGIGMRASALVWSKFLALFTVCCAMVIVVMGAAVLLGLWSDGGIDMLLRGATLCLAYLMYGAIFIALALTMSAHARSSRNALVVLLALWVAFSFITPRVAVAVAERVVALPTAEQFWDAIKHDYEQGLPGEGDLATRSKRFDAQLLEKFGVARLEDIPAGAYALRRLHRDAYADKVHALHFDNLWQRYAEQEAILSLASIFSPVLAMRSVSMKLSGTDMAHRRHFEDAAETYRRYFNTSIDEWDAANSSGLRSFEDKYGGDALWQSIEKFSYQTPPISFALRAALIDIVTLFGWLLATALLLHVSCRRLQP